MKGPLIIVALAISAALLQLSIHRVSEGHVGVYWRGGALINRITKPGYHLKIPLLDMEEDVQVTLQTDKVTNIPCGTSGGVMIMIERVEVVNRLKEEFVYDTIKNYTVNYDKIWIFDKIHHEINQFCSKHTLQEVYIEKFHVVDEMLSNALQESFNQYSPGIEIIAIRITKPKIPDHILKKYEEMEAEKTKLLVAIEAQKVAEKEAETEKKKATIEADKKAAVSKIQMEQQIKEQEAQKTMKQLQDEATLFHIQTMADADFYKSQKAAEINKLLLTPEYLKLELVKSIGNTTKVYFGPSLNSMYLEFLDLITQRQLSQAQHP